MEFVNSGSIYVFLSFLIPGPSEVIDARASARMGLGLATPLHDVATYLSFNSSVFYSLMNGTVQCSVTKDIS